MRLAQRSPGVVHLVDCFEEQEVVHLVTEVCHGGDLKRHVEQVRDNLKQACGLHGAGGWTAVVLSQTGTAVARTRCSLSSR